MNRALVLTDVTVVVPTKNEEANIDRFLAAVPPAVGLVVVDSSTDTTPERVVRARGDRATIVRVDADIPTARQLGADTCRTPWVIFTDADVAFSPDYFQRLRQIRAGEKDGGIVGTKGTAGGYERYHRWFSRGQVLLDAMGIPAATGSNMLVNRAALHAVGGFDRALTVNEDTELMFRIKRAGYGVRLDRSLVVHAFDHRRLHAGVGRKALHGAVRNTALYLGLFERRLRATDWGYWSSAPAGRRRAHTPGPAR